MIFFSDRWSAVRNCSFHCSPSQRTNEFIRYSVVEYILITCVMRAYVLLSPALTPCGGSLVNLMELCRRLMGNFLCSSVVIHSLKASFTFSADVT